MNAPLKRTPLYDIHVALGAKMVPFAGWEMPVQYPTGIQAEYGRRLADEIVSMRPAPAVRVQVRRRPWRSSACWTSVPPSNAWRAST